MNKKRNVGRIIGIIVLVVAVGFGGFALGRHSTLSYLPAGNDKGDAISTQNLVKNLNSYHKLIEDNYLFDYKEKDLENGLYKGFLAGLRDPYSQYFSPEEFRSFMDQTTGNFEGVGLTITSDDDNLIDIVKVIEGSPAEKGGLKVGDKIIAIDGKKYLGEDLQQASASMKGESGTTVDVTYRRGEGESAQEKTVTLTRGKIVIHTVHSELLKNHLAYLVIDSFDESTGKDFIDQVKDLEKQGAEKLIVDLRNNGGGLVDSCEEVADYLLGESKIVTVVDKEGKEEVASSDPSHDKIPLVVLINGESASASEILVGALRDNDRALIIGEKSFGKGIVQKIFPVDNNGEEAGIKLTMAEYLTPSGDHIHEKGIEPDIEVKLPEGVTDLGTPNLKEDTQLQRAIAEAEKLDSEKVVH